ncbi:hypothetical protein J3B02_001668 [Coemansia erecta]|nr:hypothetical protein J3B02_001668 [Coemansia erecta]
MHRHKRSARKLNFVMHKIERTGSHGISTEELESSSAAFRGYLSNSHEGSQDIALLLMLRNWHTMAQEARVRRNQLQRRWVSANEFYQRSLLMDVLLRWRFAANRAAEDETSTYRIVQIALADMTRKNSLLRQVVSRLIRFRDIANQINNYYEDSSVDSNKHAHHPLYGFAQKSNLRRQRKQQQNQKAVRSTMSIITQNGVRQNSNLGRAMLKRIFGRWHEAAAVNKSAEIKAGNYYRGTSLITVFGGLQTLWNSECERKDKADDHLRKSLLRNCLVRWNKRLHIRREQLLQYRAVQDIARRRDHKRRRVLLLAWREVAERIRRSETNASELASAKKKALLSMCINQWTAASGGVYEERHARVPATTDDFYPEHVATCNRAISVQSNLMTSPVAFDSALSRSTERLELLRRVRKAEAKASQYKRLLVDPNRAKQEIIELDKDLEERLAIWHEYIERRTYSLVLQRLRNAILKPASQRQKREFVGNAELDMGDLDAKDRLFEKINKHLFIEANFMRHRLPLKDTLCRWRMAIELLADKREHAVRFYYDPRSISNTRLCSKVISSWRETLRERQNIAKAAVGIHQEKVKKQFLDACSDVLAQHEKLMDSAIIFNHRRLLVNMHATLVSLMYNRYLSRPLSVPHDSTEIEQEVENAADYDMCENEEQNEVFVGQEEHADGVEDIEDAGTEDIRGFECMQECFSIWQELISKFKDIQYRVIERLPITYREPILSRDLNLRDFDWEIVYRSQLIGQSFQIWRKVLKAKKANLGQQGPAIPAVGTTVTASASSVDQLFADDVTEKDLPISLSAEIAADIDAFDDEDGPNAEQLRVYEATIAKYVARRACKAVLHRLVLETRCQLFEKKLVGRRLDKLITSFTQRAKQANLTRNKARAFAIRSSIHNWWSSFFVHSQGLSNAAVQANGTLVNICLRHWIEQAKNRPAKRTDPKLYVKAGAFRWEKQARRTLLAWMRASSDKRIQVRLAQRDTGAQREHRLEQLADEWYTSRIVENAFVQLRMTTEQHLLLQKMQTRLANAWNDANSTRHVLLTWRSRSSPTNSMFFSTGFGE